MKHLRNLFICIFACIVLTGCGEQAETAEVPVEYTGELTNVTNGAKQEVVKKEIVETPYVSIEIVDEFGDRHEVHYYDEPTLIDDLIVGSTLTLNANEVTTIAGESVNVEYVGTEYTVDHIPLELLTGYTSYDLMRSVYDWHYKEIHTEVTLEGTMTTSGRTVPYAFSDMITKESDGYVFHSVRTMSETVDINTQNQSSVIYSNLESGDSYLNINYEEWEKLEENIVIDSVMDMTQTSDNYIETAYYEESGRYIIEGESVSVENGYIDNLITSALADYDYQYDLLSYTFRAIFDKATYQLIFADYDITYDGVLHSAYDSLELSKFNILMSNIDYNNTDSVLLPDYIGESIYEKNRPKLLCEAYYGVTPEEIDNTWLELNGILSQVPESDTVDEDSETETETEETDEGEEETGEGDSKEKEPVVEEPTVAREDIIAALIEILTTYTTEDIFNLLDYELYGVDGYEDVTELIDTMVITYGNTYEDVDADSDESAEEVSEEQIDDEEDEESEEVD